MGGYGPCMQRIMLASYPYQLYTVYQEVKVGVVFIGCLGGVARIVQDSHWRFSYSTSYVYRAINYFREVCCQTLPPPPQMAQLSPLPQSAQPSETFVHNAIRSCILPHKHACICMTLPHTHTHPPPPLAQDTNPLRCVCVCGYD